MKAQTPINRAWLQQHLAPLLSAWERQARRIDALSLRERAILFLSIVAVLAAVFDTFVLSPQAARDAQRGAARSQQLTELTQLREQFVAASRNTGDPGVELQGQLEATRAERTRLDEDLRRTGSLGEGEGLSAVLQRLLAQQPGLVLERLKLLEDVPVAVPAASAPAALPQPSAFAGMSWQGVELQVQGSYRDTQRYLQALEHELPGLRWGEMRLSAGSGQELPRLQAQVFLLKVQP